MIEEILKILNIYKNKTKIFDFCIKINFTFVIRKTLKNEILRRYIPWKISKTDLIIS